MEKSFYNGIELPAFPEYRRMKEKEKQYPYAMILPAKETEIGSRGEKDEDETCGLLEEG